MNFVFDIINSALTFWLKPMLVLAIMLYFVKKPDFRSAATNHWLLLLAVVSPVLFIFFSFSFPRIEIGILPASVAAFTEARIFSLTHSPFASQNLVTVLFIAVYLFGVVFTLFKLIKAVSETRGLARRSKLLCSAEIQKVNDILKTDFQVQREVEVRVSAELSAPVVWGVLRPQVILPSHSCDWSPARMQRVLAHEYAHVARGDWLSKLLGYILCAFFWLNPLMWKAVKQCAWHAELACDDLVVKNLNCRAEYAGDLLELSADASHQSLATLGFIKKSELYLRINAILDGGKNREAPGYVLKLGLFVWVAILLLPISVLQAKQSAYYEREFFEGYNFHVNVIDLNEDLMLDPGVPEKEPLDYLSPKEIKERYELSTKIEALYRHPIQIENLKLAALIDLRAEKLKSNLKIYSDTSLGAVDVVPLKTIKTVTPRYPDRAIYKNLEATVIVSLDVDVNGRVLNPRIVSSGHSRIFNACVLKAVKEFQYQPMLIGGQAIITKDVKETFVFTLRDTTDT